MKFDELDTQMRVFETTNDLYVLPGIFMVARVDGRSFTRLTKEVFKFEAPFDPVFRDHMVATLDLLRKSEIDRQNLYLSVYSTNLLLLVNNP